ncbi:MarR family transcriptional regulator [Kibdelosporangium lantanae]
MEITESAVRAARDVRVVVGRLRRRLKEVYDTRELTPSQISVLSRLDKNGPASTSDLATAERVRPQSVAATLMVLEERGFVRRAQDPNDGRRQLISVTETGHDLLVDSRQAAFEWLAQAMQETFTEDDRQTVIAAMALLDRLT